MGTTIRRLHLIHMIVLDDKMDRLVSMMSKLTAQDDNQNKQFKPKIYQSR